VMYQKKVSEVALDFKTATQDEKQGLIRLSCQLLYVWKQLSHEKVMEKVRKLLRNCDKPMVSTGKRKAVDIMTQLSDVDNTRISTKTRPAEDHKSRHGEEEEMENTL
jgi:hypothetical protein